MKSASSEGPQRGAKVFTISLIVFTTWHSNKGGGRSQKNPLIGLLFGQFRRLLNKIEDVLTEHDWQIKSTGTSDELLIPKFNEFYTGAIQDFAARKIQRRFRTYLIGKPQPMEICLKKSRGKVF